MKVAVAGASGYVGAELLRLLAGHPSFDVAVATGESQAGREVAAVNPALAGAYPDLRLAATDVDALDGVDVAFLALPHGASQRLVPELLPRVGHVVDLAADFRLRDAASYPTWYGEEHACPNLLEDAVHGIPELFRQSLPRARLVAAAGCYVTAASLALAPLARAAAIEPTGVIVDAASGVSGAGRQPKATSHFSAVNESFVAYGLLDHRHTPEIEQATGLEVLFTPHLAPMTRGILATCYARPEGERTTAEVLDLLRTAYADEPFVRVVDEPPATGDTYGSNSCHITARVDPRTGWVVVLAALDNLVKGAAGQAIQCANAAVGLPEDTGLPIAGIHP